MDLQDSMARVVYFSVLFSAYSPIFLLPIRPSRYFHKRAAALLPHERVVGVMFRFIFTHSPGHTLPPVPRRAERCISTPVLGSEMAFGFLFYFFLNQGTTAKSPRGEGAETSQEKVGSDPLLDDGELAGALPNVPSAGRFLPSCWAGLCLPPCFKFRH